MYKAPLSELRKEADEMDVKNGKKELIKLQMGYTKRMHIILHKNKASLKIS